MVVKFALNEIRSKRRKSTSPIMATRVRRTVSMIQRDVVVTVQDVAHGRGCVTDRVQADHMYKRRGGASAPAPAYSFKGPQD